MNELAEMKLDKLMMILNHFLISKMQNLEIEIPRGFLVPGPIALKEYLIGQKINIRTSTDYGPQNITLHISKRADDFEKLFEEHFCKDIREFDVNHIEFNISINERDIISQIIKDMEPYSLNVSTI